MKYLKKIFESTTEEELQDLCDSYFAYLYDEGFEVKVEKDIVPVYDEPDIIVHTIKLCKPNDDGPAYKFSWNEIKDYFIPFLQRLLAKEGLYTTFTVSTGIVFKYVRPKYMYDNTWYKYPEAYDTKIFQPTRGQVIKDEIYEDPSTIHYNWNCMDYLYDINIIVK